MASTYFDPHKGADRVALSVALALVGGVIGGFVGREIGYLTADPHSAIPELSVVFWTPVGVLLGAIVLVVVGLIWVGVWCRRHPNLEGPKPTAESRPSA